MLPTDKPNMYMTYDIASTAEELLQTSKASSNSFLSAVADVLSFPTSTKIFHLLESEKKSFEILLSLSRLKYFSSQEAMENIRPVLVFDEYFDKDAPSVHQRMAHKIHLLCTHESIGLQVLIVTHSLSVWKNFSDYSIVMKNGKVFSCGLPNMITMPTQLELIP